MRTTRSFRTTPTGKITCCSTNTLMETPGPALEPAIKPVGRDWWPNSSSFTAISIQRRVLNREGLRYSSSVSGEKPGKRSTNDDEAYRSVGVDAGLWMSIGFRSGRDARLTNNQLRRQFESELRVFFQKP